MPNVEFGCLPTIIGSMPHTDPEAACAQVEHYLRDVPAWPQLPKRSYLENMYVQFSQGFPSIVVKDNRIFAALLNFLAYHRPVRANDWPDRRSLFCISHLETRMKIQIFLKQPLWLFPENKYRHSPGESGPDRFRDYATDA